MRHGLLIGAKQDHLPPEVNYLHSMVNRCLQGRRYINVILEDKQNHL